MKLKLFILLLFLPLCAYSQVAEQSEARKTLSELQAKAVKQLDGLNSSIKTLQIYNENLEANWIDSQAQVMILERQSQASLNLLSDYSTRLIEHERQLTAQKKAMARIIIILAAWTLLRIARLILGMIPQTKFINKFVPWWLDLII